MNIVASSLNNVVIVTKFIMWSLNTSSSHDLYFKSDQAMAGVVNPTMALKVTKYQMMDNNNVTIM